MYSALSLALLSQVSAFGLIAIHSGSQYQNQEIKLSSDGHLSLNGETDIDASLSNGVLKVNGKGTQLYQGFPIVGDSFQSSWGQDDSGLTLDGSNSWAVCPDNNNNIAFTGMGTPSNCQNGVGIQIAIVGGGNFSSSSVVSSKPASSTVTSTHNSTVTSAHNSTTAKPTSAVSSVVNASTSIIEQTVTETVCTHESCTGISTANGAASNGVFAGALGLLAAVIL